MNKISLCMIVKDESKVIRRCLDSVKKLIDHVFIVDTGSTDDTISVINNWMIENSIPGQVLSEPWKNFSYNRTFVLQKLFENESIDYSLMIDADEILVYDVDFDANKFKLELDKDIYDVVTNMNGFIYNRPTLTSNKKRYRYEGVVHEFLAMDGENTKGIAKGFHNFPIQDGNRNSLGDKFLKDAKLLENALNDDINDFLRSRYTFYCAQCYRDAGERELALKYYKMRSEQGFWIDEVYISLYSIANIKRDMGASNEEVIGLYLKAYECNPNRVEALYSIVHLCRISGLNHIGYMIGSRALNIGCQESALFVDKWMHDYGVLDEFSIVAFWSDHFIESKEACEKLLVENKFPEHYRDRIKSNLQFSLDRLGI